jgi:phosphate transport system substrate-binding protein
MRISRVFAPLRQQISAALTTLLVAGICGSALAETITVGGVGSMTPLLKKLGEEYKKRNPSVDVVVMHPPIGTAGGIRALAGGKLDIALSGRNLKPGEVGQAYPWLQTPLILATNGGKTKGLTSKDIADIYAGRKTTWDGGAQVRVVMRGVAETETAALRSISPEVDVAVSEALKRTDLPIAENDLDAMEVLTRISGSIGTATLGLVKADHSRLTVLSIDGKVPSVKALESGAYPWKRDYFLVTTPAIKPAAVSFLNYLRSAPALKLAREFEYLATR